MIANRRCLLVIAAVISVCTKKKLYTAISLLKLALFCIFSMCLKIDWAFRLVRCKSCHPPFRFLYKASWTVGGCQSFLKGPVRTGICPDCLSVDILLSFLLFIFLQTESTPKCLEIPHWITGLSTEIGEQPFIFSQKERFVHREHSNLLSPRTVRVDPWARKGVGVLPLGVQR